VGRNAELRQLQAAFDGAATGTSGLVMVVGEPGIGKTSVCEQLAAHAGVSGGLALTGHCYEEGSLSLPYLPFIEVMRSYVLARDAEGLRADLAGNAADVARIVPEVRDRLGHLPEPPPGDPEEQRWRLLQAVTGFLRSMSQVQPLLLVLEDLHDADRGTLDLLVDLSRNLDGARLLITGTYRDVEVDRQHPLSNTLADLRRSANFLRVPLRGLTADEVQRMMAAVAQRTIPWGFSELIHRQTEGNPLFVQEMLRYLVEEGLVSEQEGSLRRVGDETLAGRIPEGLRDVIGKRLSRLSEKTNQVLGIAAVIGRDFRLDVLQAVANLPAEEVEGALEAATSIAVVEQRPALGALGFRFTHAFFRQTLYEEIFAARRLRLHQQVGRALEALYGRRVDEHAAELAEHFAQSTDPTDLAKALEYSERAAQRAMSVYAYGEAVKHQEQALKVLEVLDPDDKVKRCDLLLALGDGLLAFGESQRVLEVVAPVAFELARALADRRRASVACQLIRPTTTGAPEAYLPQIRLWAGRSIEWADVGTANQGWAELMLLQLHRIEGNSEAAKSAQQRAIALALALGDLDLLVETTDRIFVGSQVPPEEEEQRRTLADQMSGYPVEMATTRRLPSFLSNLGGVCLTGGRRGDAEQWWQKATYLATRRGDAESAFTPLQIEALSATLDGRLDAAIEAGGRLANIGIAKGLENFGRNASGRAVRRALVFLGRADEAILTIPEPPTLMNSNGVFWGQRALMLACMENNDACNALLDRFLTERDFGNPNDPTPTASLRYLLEAAATARHLRMCRTLYPRLSPLAGSIHYETWMLFCIGRSVGAAAALLGDTDKARTYYQQAIEVCTKVRFRPELALTRLQLAELLLDHYPAERAEAIEHLDFAIRECRDMKMAPSLERAVGRRAALGA